MFPLQTLISKARTRSLTRRLLLLARPRTATTKQILLTKNTRRRKRVRQRLIIPKVHSLTRCHRVLSHHVAETGVGAKVADKVVDLEEETGGKKGGRRMLLLSVNPVLCL